eukprot:15329638-Ditylum_brightwellii.AAC.1
MKIGNYLYYIAPLEKQICAAHLSVLFSYEDCLDSQTEHMKQLLGNLATAEADPEYWITAIDSGRATFTTDGSVIDGYSAHGILLTTTK